MMYCSNCIIKDSHPGIHFDNEGICNVCNLDIPEDYASFYEKSYKNWIDYERSEPGKKSDYDCLLGLSGGKDSMYMLYSLLEEKKKRVLAFTFMFPYESNYALKNIEKICHRYDVDYVTYSTNLKYKELMKHVFMKGKIHQIPQWRDERNLCFTCNLYMYIKMYSFAYQMQIPYVLICADPVQAASYDTNIKSLINRFSGIVGHEYINDIFGKQLDKMTHEDEANLPKIVFPYVNSGKNYNTEKMIVELKSLGLYESNPVGTHCRLFGLINYYSYKYYDCMFYSLDFAAKVRMGLLDRESYLGFDKEFKNIICNIAIKNNITAEEKEYIKSTVRLISANEEEVDRFMDLILSMKSVADELGIKFED